MFCFYKILTLKKRKAKNEPTEGVVAYIAYIPGVGEYGFGKYNVLQEHD